MSTLIACCISAVVISTAVSLAVHGPLLLRGLRYFLDERKRSQRGGSSERHATFDRLSEILLGGSQKSDEDFQRLVEEAVEKAVENMSPDEVSHAVNTLLALGGDLSTVSRLLSKGSLNR